MWKRESGLRTDERGAMSFWKTFAVGVVTVIVAIFIAGLLGLI